jgi:hypothetical protein
MAFFHRNINVSPSYVAAQGNVRTEFLYTGRMAKAAAGGPAADKLALYEKLVATNPKVELKGATVPYTSLNGNMFSYLSKEGRLELRLPAGEREAFLKKYKAKLCEAYGKVQPEYVEVPDSLLASTGELKKFFNASYEYVSSLKPKPTAKKKKNG